MMIRKRRSKALFVNLIISNNMHECFCPLCVVRRFDSDLINPQTSGHHCQEFSGSEHLVIAQFLLRVKLNLGSCIVLQ